MDLTFPAMAGRMGNRDYYVAMVKLANVPKLFKFHDWAELPPEQRAQRVLQKGRIPEIANYILENEEGYLFSSLTASFDCNEHFEAVDDHSSLGFLTIPLEANLVINDGQHRRAGIEEVLKHNPRLGDETISVVLFPYEDLDRMQQMFSDLNRTARKTSKSLDILYNHRDLPNQLVLKMIERVPVFRNMVDKDRISLPMRSPKLFTLSSVYDATRELLDTVTEHDFDEKYDHAVQFWSAVAENLPEWKKAASGELKPSDLRQEFIHTHAVTVRSLGTMGRTLVSVHPQDWREKLVGLQQINWKRTNKEWQNIAMSGNDVVNRRQSRTDTAAFIKLKMDLPLTPTEGRSLAGITALSTLKSVPHHDTQHVTAPEKHTAGLGLAVGELTSGELVNLGLPCESTDSKCTDYRVRNRKSTLRVTFVDGHVICEQKAADTFAKTIERLGIERVMALGLKVNYASLVSRVPADDGYARKLIGSHWVVTHSNTRTKQNLLKRIADRLGERVVVEVV